MLRHLADQLRRAFEGGAWHGPAVFELLATVDAARAAQRPLPGRHSIWELTLHIAAWLDAAQQRVHGEAGSVPDAVNFPAIEDRSEAAWAAARQRLEVCYRQLHAAILALRPEDLRRPVEGQDYDVHFLLDGVIQHSLYHAGQIALLGQAGTATRDDGGRALLRHTLATLAYRAGKVLRDAPAGFAAFRAGDGSRTAAQILAHMGDLFDWAMTLAAGRPAWSDSPPRPWADEVQRFFAALQRFDDLLAAGGELTAPARGLFQGPIADALTHTGQLALLRRLHGAPVRGENYFKADIETGRTGPDQAAPRKEFD
jgi:uncharacterized damage-inducible protein DinB